VGPAVVFPTPTQVFDKDSKGAGSSRPIELNTINGIHLKVTADFKGPDIEKRSSEASGVPGGRRTLRHRTTLSIYYPREELAIIEYGCRQQEALLDGDPEGRRPLRDQPGAA
jgi:hypothetical protein